ncbi:MAG: M67 family metallopeptidase [Candidatus Methylomirabilis sp.]|nr:M67 family metallopeptidase [Deltaproteobacteria bacterium]
MLRIPAAVLPEVHAVGADAYPHEGVALLIGRERGGAKLVERVRRMKNMNTERAHDRFEIDPLEYMRAEEELIGSGREILGFVHSHPDHPSRPSETDRMYFQYWPGLSCAILAVEKGEPKLLTSWVIREVEGRFEPEKVEAGA